MDAENPQTLHDVRDNDALPEAAQHKSVSAVLRAVIDGAEGETITIGEIIDAFGERAFGFVLILFSLPNCVPNIPGIAGIVGTPVLIFGIQMMLGHRHPWLPGFVKRRSVSVAKFKSLIDVAEPRLRWLEGYCKPRLPQLFSVMGDRIVGLFAFLVAVSVLIPFPGTNFPPSIALVVVSIAVMEEDGYLLLVGYLIGIAGLAYTATVLGASYHLIRAALTSWFGI
ncbi:exopolysaccharide biosynthesis protein [Microvirga rosea]|uniref:exopolysaccharide biosynthesis protein n=1 Tax=Microvirga rosea TaxID=2715425 RepID=UPI001D09A5B5|nr:exopolysaccharide biosynthesis protein [Microvirga rosea]MCB8822352.1 exopolysaccharide biosynthesis protein [Microvirga rosea]